MRNKPISDLRRRMIEDLTVRSFSDKTKHDYIRHVETLAAFLGRSPDTVTGDDLRQFQLHQVEHGAQPSKLNSQASGLRFFFTITLGRADLTHQLARAHYPRKLPRILSPDEVARLLEAAPGPGLKYKAALSIAYGAGLRVGEIVMLRISDIDSERMLIRVEMGKGSKDRHAMLSQLLLELLRAWWRQCRSRGWLFPGRDPLLPISTRQLNRVCHMAAEAAIAEIACQNKAVIYNLLFKASSETLLRIAADPKHLGARIGITSVLHTWGSAMTHHPHMHMIVPGGGVSLDGTRWIRRKPNFFLPVRVLAKLFRG